MAHHLLVSSAHMLLFRDGARRVSGDRFRKELAERIEASAYDASSTCAALLQAGELEASLEDCAHPRAALAARLTDALAAAWLSESNAPLEGWQSRLMSLELPRELRLVRPEGYAYYALSPAAYARALDARSWRGRRAAVVGIRSIGTSLSAVVLAGLLERGAQAGRITVRPGGHPWDRQLELGGAFQRFVESWRDAHFFVVDEGPGLSGSTFLAVGEALTRAHIPGANIELLTSHAVDPSRLVAPDAARRWARFRATSTHGLPMPEGASELGGGAWRKHVYTAEREWPACHPGLERHKYRVGGGELVKFIGLDPYGEAPLARGHLLAAAGFTPQVRGHGSGYVAQSWIEGRPLRLERCSAACRLTALERLLDYLVFRSNSCPAGDANVGELETLLRVNLAEALGLELPAGMELALERPVYADGRLLPHEWIQTPDGTLLKVDAIDHGDDHLFPGPCDSAWDVAGALVEWQLSDAEARDFCARYHRRTGDDIRRRVGPYLLAYAAFRLAHSHLAMLSADVAEQERLGRDLQRYREALRRTAQQAASRTFELQASAQKAAAHPSSE